MSENRVSAARKYLILLINSSNLKLLSVKYHNFRTVHSSSNKNNSLHVVY